jgi:hypothetical protein
MKRDQRHNKVLTRVARADAESASLLSESRVAIYNISVRATVLLPGSAPSIQCEEQDEEQDKERIRWRTK